MIKVLFVCLGNICRSPLAEAIFRKKIVDAGLENELLCDSAGTANYHVGDAPDPRTTETAKKHEVSINHRGQQFSKSDEVEFYYLLAMDSSNYQNMVNEMGEEPERLFLMRYFDPVDKNTDVPDPYYGGGDEFERVYQILDRSLDGFMTYIKSQHDLGSVRK